MSLSVPCINLHDIIGHYPGIIFPVPETERNLLLYCIESLSRARLPGYTAAVKAQHDFHSHVNIRLLGYIIHFMSILYHFTYQTPIYSVPCCEVIGSSSRICELMIRLPAYIRYFTPLATAISSAAACFAFTTVSSILLSPLTSII